jgi:hypothetical protein
VADAYLDATYVRAHLGTAYDSAVVGITGVSATVLFESATSVIQTAMRNSGYDPPSTTDPDDVEEFVKLATLGCYRELLAGVPEGSIPLPESWATHPAKLAYAAILSGDAKLAATPTVGNAVGGALFSDGDPDSTSDDARPARASRSELSGW